MYLKAGLGFVILRMGSITTGLFWVTLRYGLYAVPDVEALNPRRIPTSGLSQSRCELGCGTVDCYLRIWGQRRGDAVHTIDVRAQLLTNKVYLPPAELTKSHRRDIRPNSRKPVQVGKVTLLDINFTSWQL